MRNVKALLFLTAAPLLGMAIAFCTFSNYSYALQLPLHNTEKSIALVEKTFFSLQGSVKEMAGMVNEQEASYIEQEKSLDTIGKNVTDSKKLSDNIYEERILAMLGPPVKEYFSAKVEIKIFKLAELGYRGYIAKMKLHDPSVLKVVLAQDKLGQKETTSAAVARTGAVFGINGGGFYTEIRDGEPYALHIGNTIIDGKFVGRFNNYDKSLFFAGINHQGELIGGIFDREDALMMLNPWQGVSFVPVLLVEGKKVPIPDKWKVTRQPRTIIGEYANDDLIMIVVDGRNSNWSSGVTLERLQDKLLELGVKEAYNLDGGGSTAMVYMGEVMNCPSDGKERPVVTNIVIIP